MWCYSVGKALQGASCDLTVNQHMLVISILFHMLLEPPHLGIACLHSVKGLARSVVVAYMQDSDYLHFGQAMQCMQQQKQ